MICFNRSRTLVATFAYWGVLGLVIFSAAVCIAPRAVRFGDNKIAKVAHGMLRLWRLRKMVPLRTPKVSSNYRLLEW